MEYFVILTCSIPAEEGMRQMTFAQIVQMKGATSRESLFSRALSQFPAIFVENLNVVFFSAEPNHITT